jgi:hypothetical protein
MKKTTKKKPKPVIYYETYSAPKWAWKILWGVIKNAEDLTWYGSGVVTPESPRGKIKAANKAVVYEGEGNGPLSKGTL